jgi:uncharacterized protein
MGIKNIVGQAASGENFFKRPEIVTKIKRAILNGSNILISSPRRVGKTSILLHLVDTAEDVDHYIYIITQSINSENEFYKRLYSGIIDSGSGGGFTKIARKTKDYLRTAIEKIKSVKVDGIGGIELNMQKEIDYKERFLHFLKKLPMDGQRLIIMIDEFTQTLENIIVKEGADNALHFLQSIRECRFDGAIKDKILFIYTGSIGLENVANKLSAIDLVSDLDSVKVSPFSRNNAIRFVHALLEELDFSMDDRAIEYMLDKIDWFIPFYIKIFIQEIHNVCIDEGHTKATKSIIDNAFEQMLAHRNYFEHWYSRLRKTFKKKDYKFTIDLLNHIADKKTIDSNAILNLAVKNKKEESYKDILKILMYDGYINNSETPQVYRFNSPILRAWWYQNVTN